MYNKLMRIDTLANTYTNKGSFANTKSFIRSVNRMLELSPDDCIYPEHYIEQFQTIVCKMVASETYPNTSQLISKLGCITGALNRIYTDKPNPFSALVKSLSSTLVPLDMPVRQIDFTAPPWQEICDKLDKVLADPYASINAKNIAICFRHDYVLRISEIFNTTFVKMEGFNHLDLENRTWTIVNHKTVHRTKEPRRFTVTEEFCNDIKKLKHDTCQYLLYKNNLTGYTSATTQHTAGMGAEIPCNSECRNSYEQWAWRESGRSQDEALAWSVNVLGHSEATVLEYYTKQNVTLEINDKIKHPETIVIEPQDMRRQIIDKKTGKVLGRYRWF
jgi:hypothetical protein